MALFWVWNRERFFFFFENFDLKILRLRCSVARKTASVSLELLSQSFSILSIARGASCSPFAWPIRARGASLCFGLSQLRVWTAGVSEVILPTSSAALFLVAHSPLCTTSFWGSIGVRKKEKKERENGRKEEKEEKEEKEKRKKEKRKKGKGKGKGKGTRGKGKCDEFSTRPG